MARLFALLALVCSAQAFTFAPAAGAVGRQSTVSMSTRFTDPYVQKMKKKNPMTGSTKNLKGYTVGSRAPKVAKSSGTTVVKGYKTNGGIGAVPRGQNVPTAAVLLVPVGLFYLTDFLGKTWGAERARSCVRPSGRGGAGNWGGHGHGDGVHKRNRAKIIDVPQEVLTVSPGETIFKQVEMRNNTHWPYKPGCSIRSYFTNKATEVLGTVNVPIDFEVGPLTNYKVTVPLNIKDEAVASDETITADFALTGPMGCTFGEPIQLKFKIAKKLDEFEFFQIAMRLFEDAKKTHPDAVFEDVIECLKNGGTEEAARKLISEIYKPKSSLTEETQMEL